MLKNQNNYSVFKGTDICIEVGIIFYLFLSAIDTAYLGIIATFTGLCLIGFGAYRLKENSKWFKYAYYDMLITIIFYGYSTLVQAFYMPQVFRYINTVIVFFGNLTIVFLFVALSYGISEIYMKNNKESKKKMMIATLFVFMYFLTFYGVLFTESTVLYGILIASGLFIYVAIIICSFLSFRDLKLAKVSIKIIDTKEALKKLSILTAAAILMICITVTIVFCKDNQLKEIESIKLETVKLESGNELRSKLIELGIPKKYTDLLNDEEALKYKDAVKCNKLENIKTTQNEIAKQETSQTDKDDNKELKNQIEEYNEFENTSLYKIDLSNGDSRILLFFEPNEDAKQIKRFQQGIIIKADGKDVKLTDINGRMVSENGNELSEKTFSILEINTRLEDRIKNKLSTYKESIESKESFDASNDTANVTAISGLDKEYSELNCGYIGFNIKDGTKEKYSLYMKYIMQKTRYNYPYENIEEILYKYVDGYQDSIYYTMPMKKWDINN